MVGEVETVSRTRLRLNQLQQEAVEAPDQHLAIIAGPGTGKTLTLATRIAFFLERGVPSSELCAITFTQKAATELRERVARLVRPHSSHDLHDSQDQPDPHTSSLQLSSKQLPFIGTFHKLAYQELRRLQPELRVVSMIEQEQLLKQAVTLTAPEKKQGKKLNFLELKRLVTRFQNKTVTLNELEANTQQAIRTYQALLEQKQGVDFDGLLLHWQQALEQGVATRFPYILIDEFQDTNQLQLEIITKLLTPDGSLSVIGDPRQAIYGFRGASSHSFNWLSQQFSSLRVVQLQTNYRSGAKIIQAAQRLFPSDPPLQPTQTYNGTVQLIETLDEYTEAELVVREIEQQVGGTDLLQSTTARQTVSGGISFADIAVLYRSRGLCKQVMRSLAAKGIPYQVVGEESMFAEPQCLLTVVGLYSSLGGDVQQLFELQPELAYQLDSVVVDTLKTEQTDTIGAMAQALATQTGWEQMLTKNSLWRNQWQQWLSGLVRFSGITSFAKCRDFLVEQLTHQGFAVTADRVTLLTMHAAKGLEFETVFLLACEQGVIPHHKATELAEEKRLFYVALTRAKQHLVLLLARKRTGKPVKQSLFLSEIRGESLSIEQDEALPATLKKRAKYQAKKNQMALF